MLGLKHQESPADFNGAAPVFEEKEVCAWQRVKVEE